MQSQPIQILTLLGTDPLEILGAGGAIRAVVESGERGLNLVIGQLRVPVPEGSALEAGQRVMVELVKGSQGSELHVRPLGTPVQGAVAAGNNEPAPIANLFTALLQVLANETEAPVKGELLSQVSLLKALFTGSGKTGDLQALVKTLESAFAAGIKLNGSWQILQLVAGLVAEDTVDFSKVIKSWSRSSGQTFESMIARALQSGKTELLEQFLQTDVRAALLRLPHDKELLTFLKNSGQLQQFREEVGRLADRLAAVQLQNVHGNGHGYVFLDIPFASALGFDRAQIHIYGEPGKHKQGTSAKEASVVFDLTLSRLGNLWIELHIAGSICSCRFWASKDAAEEIKTSASELTASLQQAGYRVSRIEVEPWDGNRVRQLLSLMQRHAPLDVSV